MIQNFKNISNLSISKTDCTSTKENWMCLNCGTVLCGRYENSHALKHSGDNVEHCVCLNTLNLSIYCYECDDFVINDYGKNVLDSLRHELRDDDTSSETSTSTSTMEETSTSSSSSKSQQETRSTSSSDSGWGEEPALVRKLRPRKRTISSDSSEGTKRKTLRKVYYL